MKKCTKCKQMKQLYDFCKNRAKHDGLHSSCRECNKEYAQRYRLTHKKEVKEYHDKWQRENPDKHWQYTKKWRANKSL